MQMSDEKELKVVTNNRNNATSILLTLATTTLKGVFGHKYVCEALSVYSCHLRSLKFYSQCWNNRHGSE